VDAIRSRADPLTERSSQLSEKPRTTIAAEKRFILVGHRRDEHIEELQRVLSRMGYTDDVARVWLEMLPDAPLVWRPGQSMRLGEVEIPQGRAPGLYRRPGPVDAATYEPRYGPFVAAESSDAFHRALEALGVRWVTSSRDLTRAEYKLVQLQAANSLGIQYPDTVVTNLGSNSQPASPQNWWSSQSATGLFRPSRGSDASLLWLTHDQGDLRHSIRLFGGGLQHQPFEIRAVGDARRLSDASGATRGPSSLSQTAWGAYPWRLGSKNSEGDTSKLSGMRAQWVVGRWVTTRRRNPRPARKCSNTTIWSDEVRGGRSLTRLWRFAEGSRPECYALLSQSSIHGRSAVEIRRAVLDDWPRGSQLLPFRPPVPTTWIHESSQACSAERGWAAPTTCFTRLELRSNMNARQLPTGSVRDEGRNCWPGER
jgi:hypothetical protein